ncbi:hypothetical protein HCU74_00780 [Spongiibacter sp. KMU-166]|uniref:Uncharacterized protein n=1 Tax=Spongiibacter thalassae TaxID=2721624 RepID=A0ABX1G9V4_9GAMM|nr:hypothetical protein [Spongiibacter thalassae]NKI15940.1 hypothetical protein [Spongiibacter thalassae]
MCTAVPKACERGDKYLDMRGIVRATIAQGFRITDGEVLERNLPTLLNELMTYSCDIKSVYALSDVPFHHQKRNIAKRAIFTGQVKDFFNQFLFDDYGYRTGAGQRRVRFDINAVEMVDGEPETLLDYVDKVLGYHSDTYLAEEQRGNVELLRLKLVNRDAVNARNLDCAAGQKTGCSVSMAYRQWQIRAPQREACRQACYPTRDQIPSHIKVGDTYSSHEEQLKVNAEISQWSRPIIQRCDEQCAQADPQP